MASPIAFPPSDAEVTTFDSGLELIVRPDRSAPVVSVQCWVRTGSIFEGSLLGSGTSHLVEHMVFQGAGGKGPGELAKAVQESGGYLNAYTSFDRTVYWIDTLKEGFDTALDTVAALCTEATFPEAEFAKETDVIRREIDMGKDDPGRALSQLMFSTVFRRHPFREPVIGRLEMFNQVSRDAAFNYYRSRYTPPRMFVVVAGDVEPDEVRRKVAERFAAAPSVPGDLPHLEAEPEQYGRRDAHLEFPTELTRAELAWRIPHLLHPDTPALEVLGVLLGGGRASRLFREVRERRGLVHGISAGAWTPSQDGAFYIGAQLDPDKRAAAEQAILDQVSLLQDNGVTEAEVARARRMFLSDQIQGLTTMRGMASDLGSNWLAAGNLDFTRDYLAAVDRVTPAQVQAVAQKYLTDSRLSSVSLNPQGSLTRASISVRKSEAADVRRHVFSNGLTLLVREDARLPLVALHASSRGGLLAETAADNGIGRLMARSLVKGTTTRSAEEMADLIESGGGSIGADSGGSSWSASAQVLTPELETGIALWSDMLLRPAFAAEEVERERGRQLAAIRQEEDHPSYIAFRELRRAAYGTHPFALGRNGVPESVAALTRAQVADFHRARLAAGNTVLSVFGDVSFEETVARIGEAFAAMPAGPRQESGTLPGLPAAAGRVLLSVPHQKRQAFLVAGFRTVDLMHPDRIALDLIDEACSDMASRFFERIREQHGLAYSVGTSQIVGMAPGMFTFYLSTSPEQLEFAREQLLDEVRLLAADGLAADELDRARRTWLGKTVMQNQSNASVAQQAALDELYGHGFNHQKEVLDRVKSITRDEVADVCRRWFQTEDQWIVQVTPGA